MPVSNPHEQVNRQPREVVGPYVHDDGLLDLIDYYDQGIVASPILDGSPKEFDRTPGAYTCRRRLRLNAKAEKPGKPSSAVLVTTAPAVD
jgi:hypothetical protein